MLKLICLLKTKEVADEYGNSIILEELADEIIVDILSPLPVKDAVATSVL